MSVAHARYTEQRVEYNVRLCTARVWFRTQGVARFSEVLYHFCFAWAATPRQISDPRTADGTSGATPSTMPTLLRAEVMMLGFCQAGRPGGLRIVRQDCHGLCTVYFLGESGTLFVRCDLWHLARFSACHQHPSVGVGSETSVFARPLRGASPFRWVPCVRFGRLLQLRWRRQCVAGATMIFTTTLKTVAAWSLVLALSLTFAMASTVFIVAQMRCRIRKWKNTGLFSHGRTRSSLAVWQEFTTLLQRQERQITPRCVTAGGVPIKTCIVARKR